MRIQNILGSPPFIVLGMVIARALPRRWGYVLSRAVGRRIARKRRHLYRTLRANLAHVVGPTIPPEALDALTETTIQHAGCTYFDMFRARPRDYRLGRVTLDYDKADWERVLSCTRDGRGLILVGPHVSNFDLASQWIAAHGVSIQGLSLREPNLGTRVVNWLRRSRGIEMTPIDVGALRLAMARLKAGGVVMTGVDRPVSPEDEPLPFFGEPARLPVGHVRLALQTGARVVVACCTQRPSGRYALHVSEPMEMVHTGTRARDIRENALRVLAVVEDMIRIEPGQWLMFVPVWGS